MPTHRSTHIAGTGLNSRRWEPTLPDALPEWHRDALCAQSDPEMFFPEKGEGDAAREAKRTCLRCPSRVKCLEDALEKDEKYGVRGGLTARERRKLRRPA